MKKRFTKALESFTKTWEGFSFIELMVVIAIIGILVGIGLIYMGGYEKKQRDERRKQDITAFANAIEQFKADHGHYPFINWGDDTQPGVHPIHAWEAVNSYTASTANPTNYTAACDGTFGSFYSPIARDCATNPDPGDPLWHPQCDLADPRHANYKEFNPGTMIVFENGKACDDLSLQLLGKAYLSKMPASPSDPANWVTDYKELREYTTSIPKDPRDGEHVDSPNNAAPGFVYRYLYNSYYQCSPEGIQVGDKYWLNAAVETETSGEKCDTCSIDVWYYEVGTANWFRHPRSECG